MAIHCPIWITATILSVALDANTECLKAACAWWNAEAEGCGIVRNLSPVQEYEGEDETEEPGEPFRVL